MKSCGEHGNFPTSAPSGYNIYKPQASTNIFHLFSQPTPVLLTVLTHSPLSSLLPTRTQARSWQDSQRPHWDSFCSRPVWLTSSPPHIAQVTTSGNLAAVVVKAMGAVLATGTTTMVVTGDRTRPQKTTSTNPVPFNHHHSSTL
ncbi:hypothetical protein Pmani_039277 [Petrolisthes manimaculis]|uniref:Uncharacterized protein n=1 Tax=Petrolisthes manimaculis TaxID=1843537 RepID=A0AAE1NCZ7_9EUCA|nr:hypothetical protein Pmani_039277 [Petrolisthes manimaculis]